MIWIGYLEQTLQMLVMAEFCIRLILDAYVWVEEHALLVPISTPVGVIYLSTASAALVVYACSLYISTLL